MTELDALNPEIEALLREVAADPESCLLRLPAAEIREGVRNATLPERAGLTGLRPAERELLRTWRRETAFLLLVACYRKQVTAPQNKFRVIPVMEKGRFPAAPQVRWTRFARVAFGLQHEDALLRALALLGQCASSSGSRWPTVFELAAASSRLEPSNGAKNYAALEFAISGQPLTCLRMLQGLESNHPTFTVMETTNTALAYEQLGRHDLALARLRDGPWPDRARFQQAFSTVLLAAQVRDTKTLDRWARRLEEHEVSDGTFKFMLRALVDQRRRGDWIQQPGALDLLRAYARRGGERMHLLSRAFEAAETSPDRARQLVSL